MDLLIFNPEHDMALANNKCNFTIPKSVKEFRNSCDFLPILWAKESDIVLVNDPDKAISKASHLTDHYKKEQFVTAKDIGCFSIDKICPWGWDKSICFELRNIGIEPSLLPNEEKLQQIRQMSSRSFSSQFLNQLKTSFPNQLIGSSKVTTTLYDVKTFLQKSHKLVIKSPWSCSGRGVRYIENTLNLNQQNWINNIILQQGYIMVEPYYDKILDFGMEFKSDKQGVHFCGLSIFDTHNGAYKGNLLCPESQKEELLSRYISIYFLHSIKDAIIKGLSNMVRNIYEGPLGVDMMIVKCGKGESFYLHPMVEINLRRTMGHVALNTNNLFTHNTGSLKIVYENGHYNIYIK